jgi:parallel beta-helix repeat protein
MKTRIHTPYFAICALILLLALPAQAQVVCGQNVVSNAKLTENLVCPNEAGTQVLTVTGARLDMNGFNIHCEDDSDDGIVLEGSRSHLLNGSVSGCDDGVVLDGAGRHTVSDVISHGNANEGFRVLSGNNNLSNVSAVGNEDHGVQIDAGKGSHLVNSYFVGNADDGVRLGDESRNTTLVGNLILGNGDNGISIAPSAPGNNIRSNLIVGSTQSGIRVGSDGNKISGNDVRANLEGGILLTDEAAGNSIQGNSATGNNIDQDGHFDMEDENVDCGTNKWTGNTFGTSNDPCIN